MKLKGIEIRKINENIHHESNILHDKGSKEVKNIQNISQHNKSYM